MTRSPDGKNYRCKACNVARVRQWVRDNPEKHRARQAAYNSTNSHIRAQKARDKRDKENPSAPAKRLARETRREQLQDAIDYAKVHPMASRRDIMEWAGLNNYLWKMIGHRFELLKLYPTKNSPMKFTYTLIDDSDIDTISTPIREIIHAQPTKSNHATPKPGGLSPSAGKSIPTFGELSSRLSSVTAEPARQPDKPAVVRTTVSQFRTDYDD